MSRGVNKWIGIGNCCQDPDVRSTQGGTQVVNLTIACNDEWYDKNAGHKKDRTEFVRLVFFGKLAEIAAQYLNKGSQIYVEGRLQTRKWQDKSGQDRYTTEIVVSQMNMLGGGQRNGSENNSQNAPQQPSQMPPSNPQGGGFDESIPF